MLHPVLALSSSRVLALTLLLGGCTAGGEGPDEAADETGTGNGDTTDATETSTDTDTDTETGTETTTGEDTGVEGDPIAAAACDAFAGASPEPIIAAATAEEAATATIVPDGATVYDVTLPEGAPGFLSLEIAEWNTTQAFFTVAEIDYVVTVPDNVAIPYPRMVNAMCPDAGITDQRIFFEMWTPALIEFSAEGPRQIPLMVIQQSP